MILSLRIVLAAAAISTAIAATPPALRAQSPAQRARDASDMKTLAAYRLTMPAVRKLAAAYENMILLAADSALARRVQRDRDNHPAESAASIEDMAELFGRHAPIRAAITRAGLTPREFTVANLSLMQSTMVVGYSDLAKARGQPFNEAASGASPANLAFVRENRAEIEVVMATLKAWQDAQARAAASNRTDGDSDDEVSGEGAEEGEEPPR